MEHLAALMLVIACGNTPESCDVLPAPVTGYQSMQACRQAIPAVLGSSGETGGLIVARCLEVDPADERPMEIVWDVNEKNGLEASVQAVDEPAPATEGPAMMAQADMPTGAQGLQHVLSNRTEPFERRTTVD